MANHMAEVAKMLGVELCEEFNVVFGNGHVSESTYYFVESGIYNVSKGYFEGDLIVNLLAGISTIKRKPWKPQNEESYWYVDEHGDAWRNNWDDCDFVSDHMNYYKLGNCYRTQQEAEANRDKWVAFYASDEVLEV